LARRAQSHNQRAPSRDEGWAQPGKAGLVAFWGNQSFVQVFLTPLIEASLMAVTPIVDKHPARNCARHSQPKESHRPFQERWQTSRDLSRL
jgi:hypothetical protein